ncbi:serine hydrolase domain-containing protein [Sphingomicrobium marinum]|uniref:serine hydrolase domain-containing protein n=1 Tax=Sphingomicrobium marinum TaxID=1227950 RepID=UPI00224078DE|nr:serine hydrolase domain-containing protein [Sphingomicrobium marinum]
MTFTATARAALLIGAALPLASAPAAALNTVQEAAAAQAPATTPRGTEYVIPDDWTMAIENGTYVFTLPEGDSSITLVEIEGAEDGPDAIAKGWAIVNPDFSLEAANQTEGPGNNGWDAIYVMNYPYPPAERRFAQAVALQKDGQWTAVFADLALATAERRGAQFGQFNAGLKPGDFEEVSLAGNPTAELTPELIAEWTGFIEGAMDDLKIPGAAIAIIKDGQIVHSAGLGVKNVETGEPVDTDTLFMVGSNTKGMTTLLIGTMVEDGLIAYDQPVTNYMSDFKLGDAETTEKVLVKHLICACTGLPRKDLEWVLNQPEGTPASNTFALLAATQPTTDFGELFQYNNTIAAAAGYVAGHVLYPDMEVGAAYDRAMHERVFEPLGMDNVTFRVSEAVASNHAAPHGLDADMNAAAHTVDFNEAIYPVRPAGALWADIDSFARYVANEMSGGINSEGERVMPEAAVFDRRAPQVAMGADSHYGMGIMTGDQKGIATTFHGGSTFGYQSNYNVYIDRGIGIAMLTNAGGGTGLIAESFDRFNELVFGDEPDAASDVERAVEQMEKNFPQFWEKLERPASADMVAKLASAYTNDALGRMTIEIEGDRLFFVFPNGRAEVATREEDDGSTSFVTFEPSFLRGVPILMRDDGKLVLADAQHEYVYTPVQ